MRQKWVTSTLDSIRTAEMAPEVRENLEELRSMKDEDIDFSDIPEADDDFFRRAVSMQQFFRARKQSTTVRIDADVLHWLKKDGKGYQSRLNAILRKEMMRSIAPAKPKRKATAPAARSTRPAAAKQRKSA